MNSISLRGEGVWARELWVAPAGGMGHRRTGDNVPKPIEGAGKRWDGAVRRLLAIKPPGREADGTRQLYRLTLSPEALTRVYAYEAWVESRIGFDGELYAIRDWAGKSHGQVVRIAIMLHAIEWAASKQPEAELLKPIAEKHVTAAVEIVKALAPHAYHVLEGPRRDRRLDLARYVLDRLLALPEDGRTVKALLDACRGKAEIIDAEDPTGCLREILRLLENRYYLHVTKVKSGRAGRPPEKITVSRKVVSKISEIPPEGSQREDSADSADGFGRDRQNVPGDSADFADGFQDGARNGESPGAAPSQVVSEIGETSPSGDDDNRLDNPFDPRSLVSDDDDRADRADPHRCARCGGSLGGGDPAGGRCGRCRQGAVSTANFPPLQG